MKIKWTTEVEMSREELMESLANDLGKEKVGSDISLEKMQELVCQILKGQADLRKVIITDIKLLEN